MNEHQHSFISIMKSLDCTVNIIRLTSDSFINIITEDISTKDDLFNIILFYYKDDTDHKKSLAVIYLLNDIILKVNKSQNLKPAIEKDVFEFIKFINTDLTNNKTEATGKILSELARITKIWIEKNIFEQERLNELMILTVDHLDYPLQNYDDSLFNKLLEKGDIPHYAKIFEFDRLFKNQNEPKEIREYIINSVISDQFDIAKRNINILCEVDSLLTKLNMIK